jgi:SAM-dependent methyltransferase
VNVYDPIADVYDAWNQRVTEDIAFYVDEAVAAGGPIIELGVGTGRVAVPTAEAGVPVIGIDSSARMLEICRRRAAAAGVAGLLDLRLGDFRRPPVEERVRLVTCPFRAYLHLHGDEERVDAFRAALDLLEPGGRLVFDVFAPSTADIRDTNHRWLEREPGIWERADWRPTERRLDLSVRGDAGETTMQLAWLPPARWRRLLDEAGFVDVACYGWFDRRLYRGGEDTVWVAHRPRASLEGARLGELRDRLLEEPHAASDLGACGGVDDADALHDQLRADDQALELVACPHPIETLQLTPKEEEAAEVASVRVEEERVEALDGALLLELSPHLHRLVEDLSGLLLAAADREAEAYEQGVVRHCSNSSLDSGHELRIYFHG